MLVCVEEGDGFGEDVVEVLAAVLVGDVLLVIKLGSAFASKIMSGVE